MPPKLYITFKILIIALYCIYSIEQKLRINLISIMKQFIRNHWSSEAKINYIFPAYLKTYTNASRLTLGLHLDISIVSSKYHKSECI